MKITLRSYIGMTLGVIMLAFCATSHAQSYWELGGNSNLQTTDFLGSTTGVPVRFKSSTSDYGMTLNGIKLGVGIGPSCNLHVHSTIIQDPGIVVPSRGDSVINRDDPYFGDLYTGEIRITNPNTGSSDNDGFGICQRNTKVTLLQRENDILEIKGYTGSGIVLKTNGNIEMTTGTTSFNNISVGGMATTVNFHATGNFTLDGNLSVGANFLCNSNGDVTANSLTVGNGFSCNNNGYVKAKEIKVTLTDWPDYVFEEGYDRLSLPETEKYIKENGHLPDVPSAQEVEENGVSLGEINAKLLQKIEELTLHIIDLQKQIDELKQGKE
ncbi:MAG: hypothetical protein IJQ89_00835 [Bacteroidales bacterium]|nr:hypothetical protein [Bacteroidales bacterium]